MTKRIACVVLCGLLWVTGTQAITVVPVTFEQLVDESVAVVYARVNDVRGQWTDDRNGIDSIVTLDALRYFKGNLGDTVSMRLPGGEAGGRLNVIPGAPVVRQGDLLVLFLRARGPSIPIPVGLSQGVFRVVVDARTRSAHVTPPPLKASNAGRIIRGAAERRLLSLDAFASTVQQLSGAAR
jgi:hypothetical protein